MVIAQVQLIIKKCAKKVQLRLMFKRYSLLLCTLFLFSACGTTDKARLKESRDAFTQAEWVKSETALYTPEIYENEDNRLLHYYLLGSVGMSQGQYEKAIYFFNKARDTAKSVRSSSGSFEWFSSKYLSNPIEYSYLHYYLSLSYALLAEEGKTDAWSTPEMKDKKGNVVTPVQNFPAQNYDSRTIADFRQKARAELLAWDTHLQDLKRTYPDQKFYQEDLWARLLASYTHSLSSDHSEKRTAELLAGDALKILQGSFQEFPSIRQNQNEITSLIDKLNKRAKSKSDSTSLFVLEAGVMDPYKIKRFNLGISTLFSQIKNPQLRASMEQMGMQIILQTAPEFGLVMFAGGLVGAASSGGDDDEFDGPPQFFSDAVDRGMGFEIDFPSLSFPPTDTMIKLQLSQNGIDLPEIKVPVVSPVQEIIATELKNREKGEMFQKAVTIGVEYLAVLIPAIQTYRQAGREGNVLKKLGVLAGYFLAKKAIDHAHQPDLRSWNYLPKLIAASVVDVSPGEYDAKVSIENSQGKVQQSIGKLVLGKGEKPIVRFKMNSIDLLKSPKTQPKALH